MALSTVEIAALSDDRLLAKIAEEASEVTKAAMKMFAHGARPLFCGVQYNNVRDVNDEFCQLQGLIVEFRARFGWL